MLQEMRKYTRSWVASLVLLVPLAGGLALWGIGDIFRGRIDNSVATVGDVEIPVQKYQRDLQNALRQQRNSDGSPMTMEQARALGMPKQFLDSMIATTALDNQARALGLTIDDDVVVREIHRIPAFAGPTGTFDRNVMLAALQRVELSEQDLIDNIRSTMIRSQLTDAASNGFSFPYNYTRAVYSLVAEKRAVDYIVMPTSAAGTVPVPDDAALLAYMKAHTARFSTPEYRTLTYVSIGPEDLIDKVKVSDQQIAQQYEVDKAKYEIPETRDVQQIPFADEAAARAASAKIKAGTTFADIATLEKKSDADISLGTIVQADLAGDRGKAAFTLPEGGTSEPVKGTFGWVILHVTKITPGVHKSLDEVKEDIRKEVAAQLAQAQIGELMNSFDDIRAGGANLSEAGKKAGLHVNHVAAVDRSGLAPDGSKAGVPADPDFITQVFTAEVGEDEDAFETKDGHSYVIMVDGVTPPKLKALDVVKAQVTGAWQKEQAQKRLDAKAKQLTAQASSAQSLANVAKTLGLTAKNLGPLDRGSKDAPMTPQLLQKIFAAKPGTAVYSASPDGNGIVIALVTGVTHPPNSPADQQAMALGQQLQQMAHDDFENSLGKHAREIEGTQLNQANIDKIVGEGS